MAITLDNNYNNETLLSDYYPIIQKNQNTIADEINNHEAAEVLDHPDGSVTTAKLVDGAVTRTKIATGAVSNTKILNDAVDTRTIQAGAVTENELAEQSVTFSKLSKQLQDFQSVSNGITRDKNFAITLDPATQDDIDNGTFGFRAITVAMLKYAVNSVKRTVLWNEIDSCTSEGVYIVDNTDKVSLGTGNDLFLMVQETVQILFTNYTEEIPSTSDIVIKYRCWDAESATWGTWIDPFTLKPASTTQLGGIKLKTGSGSNMSGIIVDGNGVAVLNVSDEYGLQVGISGGKVATRAATEDDIETEENAYKPIVSSNLRYAVNHIVGEDIVQLQRSTRHFFGICNSQPDAEIKEVSVSSMLINNPDFKDGDLITVRFSQGFRIGDTEPTLSINGSDAYQITTNGIDGFNSCFDKGLSIAQPWGSLTFVYQLLAEGEDDEFKQFMLDVPCTVEFAQQAMFAYDCETVGRLSELKTETKSSTVDAINEIKGDTTVDTDSTVISLTLTNGATQIYTNAAITSLQVLLPDEVTAGFISGITFLYSDNVNFDIPDDATVEYSGIDCINGVFVPTNVGRSYDMIYDYNGIEWKCRIG